MGSARASQLAVEAHLRPDFISAKTWNKDGTGIWEDTTVLTPNMTFEEVEKVDLTMSETTEPARSCHMI